MDDEIDLNRYELKEGDLIRIGRICLRLKIIKNEKYENNNNLIKSNILEINANNKINKYICVNSPNNRNNNINHSIATEVNLEEIQVNSPIYRNKSKFISLKNNINKTNINEEKKEQFCRICYEENYTDENPLLQPCSCQGSMKYIHLNCLRHWLNTNNYILVERNEYSKCFKYKEAECELCKTKLPNFIRHKGKFYQINEFEKDFKNYAIFECLTPDKNNDHYLYMISLDNDNNLLSIGRAQYSSLVIKDESISRNHCALRYINNKLFLEYCGSKFGTLILYQKEIIKLIDELKLYLQIGRSFIKCKVENSYSLFGCCNISETYNFDFYYKQNKIKNENFNKMTVKTEIDSDNNDENNKEEIEDEKNIKINKASKNGKNYLLTNQIKIMGEENLITDLDIFSFPAKLNIISECKDENNNEINKSDADQNRYEEYKESKNN